MLPVSVLVAVIRHLTVKPKGRRFTPAHGFLEAIGRILAGWGHMGDAPDLPVDQKAERLTGSRTRL